MRNRIPFGYTPFGGEILVKLNVKLSAAQAETLVQKYKGLIQWDNGKYGRAIEGFVNYSRLEHFHKDLDLLKIDSKIERLMEQKTALLDKSITQIDPPNFDLI